ncbi:hypothetical protein DsansV1_C01g0012041 [Dioscorea sansibarensis]
MHFMPNHSILLLLQVLLELKGHPRKSPKQASWGLERHLWRVITCDLTNGDPNQEFLSLNSSKEPSWQPYLLKQELGLFLAYLISLVNLCLGFQLFCDNCHISLSIYVSLTKREVFRFANESMPDVDIYRKGVISLPFSFDRFAIMPLKLERTKGS